MKKRSNAKKTAAMVLLAAFICFVSYLLKSPRPQLEENHSSVRVSQGRWATNEALAADSPADQSEKTGQSRTSTTQQTVVASQTNSTPDVSLEFIWVPPGTFFLGSDDTEPGRRLNETLTSVTLTYGFWLSKYEVTWGQYLGVAGTNEGDPGALLTKTHNLPVDVAFWLRCTNFFRLLNDKGFGGNSAPEGYIYRLPTEAEWERACRTDDTNQVAYGSGEDLLSLTNYAWFNGNSGGVPHPVGSRLPNAWGFYDMQGNVREACADVFFHPGGSVTNPFGRTDGVYMAVKGGSWTSPPEECRCAWRHTSNFAIDVRSLGFRVALAPALPDRPTDPDK